MIHSSALIANIMMDEVMVKRGKLAAQEGASADTNPYRTFHHRHLWNQGYADGMLGISDSAKTCQEILTEMGV
jgi:ribosome modulation factor